MRATANVVLSYRIERGTLPKKLNAALCPSQNASAVYRRIGLHKAGVAVRKVHRKEMDLAFDPGDLRQCLTKIHLRVTGIARYLEN